MPTRNKNKQKKKKKEKRKTPAPSPRIYRGPCRASYFARTFLHLPSSFRRSATSWRRAEFSFSRNEARMAIWFSFSRRASLDRLAAMLFFLRLAQYLSSCSLNRERNKRGIRFQKTEQPPGCAFSCSLRTGEG